MHVVGVRKRVNLNISVSLGVGYIMAQPNDRQVFIYFGFADQFCLILTCSHTHDSQETDVYEKNLSTNWNVLRLN